MAALVASPRLAKAAEETPSPPPPARSAPRELRSPPPQEAPPARFGFDAEALFFYGITDSYRSASNNEQVIVGIGGLAALRVGALRFGGTVDTGALIFGSASTTHVGALGGASWLPRPWLTLRGDLEAGAHYTSGIGGGLFVDSVAGDTTALLPYAGLRTSALIRAGNFLIGLSAVAREDLGRRTVTPEVTSCFLSCATTQETWRAGGESLDVGLTLGFET
ncbi:MAG TPA: hypothetical protein VGI39_46460 [Polyangiaceae bacterium]